MNYTVRYLLGLLLLISGTASACDYQENFDESGSAVQLAEPSFTIKSGAGDADSKANMLTILGQVKNTSKSCIESIVVEFKFFDAQKKLIDANTEPLPGVEVMPGQEVSFHSFAIATQAKEKYVTMSAHIVSVEQKITKKPRPAEPGHSWLVDFFISWGPMILLIGVWAFFMYRMNGKKSPQAKSQELMAEQNAILRGQIKAVEKIAQALEARSSEK